MRKEDKLRPYRVDFFDIKEMKDNDLALVRSQIVRAVTADDAVYEILDKPDSGDGYPSLVLIRAYRFYKTLTHKKDVFKAVEDLFSANRAVKVMEQVEAYRAKRKASFMSNEAYGSPSVSAPGHVTRYSDSSLYDEVCVNCGATDAQAGGLNQPCPAAPQPAVSKLVQLLAEVRKHPSGSPEQKQAITEYLTALDAEPTEAITENLKALDAEPEGVIADVLKALGPEPTTGPDSPATKAVVADMQGMVAHDAHEQAMDTFVPTSVPEGKHFTLTPVPMEQHDMLVPSAEGCTQCETAGRAPTSWTLGLGGPVVETPSEPDQAVGSAGRPPDVLPACDAGDGNPLLMKVAAFATIAILVITGLLYILRR
jgi:hypothetical protein